MPQKTTEQSLVEYYFDGVNFTGKLILDAGTGAGQTTERIVDKVIEVGNYTFAVLNN